MLKYSRSLFVFLLCSLFIGALAQSKGSISGLVINADTKQPIARASVTIEGFNLSAVADTAGRYRVTDITTGFYTLAVSAIGYETARRFNIVITSGNENEQSFELEPRAAELAEVIVRSTRNSAQAGTLETPLSVQRLTSEEIKANPGGNFDISRVINSLPGVGGSSGSVGGFRNDIIIRGGGPGENVFYLDGIEIPVINHFSTIGSGGGPTGILNVSFIEDVKLSSSAFNAKYDNALSSVFEFKQKSGNTNRTQGNVRLSGTELAATVEGPLNKNQNLTYLASIRRSYLEFLFSLIDLPIRPNFWDFQYKITYRPNARSTFSLLGVGAIDQFGFGKIKENTQDKLYTLYQVPSIRQRSYAIGASYRRSLNNGFYILSISRSSLDSRIEKYDDNEESDPNKLRYKNNADQIENKIRLEVNKNVSGWDLSYGALAGYMEYITDNNIRRRAAIDTQPEDRYLFTSNIDFFRFGAFVQIGKRFFDESLGISMGIRSDINTFTGEGTNPLNAVSPRLAVTYLLSESWTINASVGRYAKLAPYTVLGFRDNNQNLVNKNINYISNVHYVAGLEYSPRVSSRFTIEGFFKKYHNVPVSIKDGISINNQGADFTTVGNEPVTPGGIGETYGLEFFVQQKLTKRFFGLLSYTLFYTKFSNRDEKLIASAWDNRHLLSLTFGYKFPKNWEIGLKYRYQGGAPYTPFDLAESQLNYITQGQGVLDYSQINTLRLNSFSVSDIRIDKKWNFRKITFDLFLDVTNWWAAKTDSYPKYTFERDLTTGALLTTDGQGIKTDGRNGVPVILSTDDATVLPTIGFIIEF